MGEFTAKLFFEETNQTVANFVSLAEGTRNWVNTTDAKIQSNVPYYDGLIFHRVIAGFMNQAGARVDAQGDSPGYTIYDEMVPNDPTYTVNRAGVLAMANTGARNSGGSQFFVTVAPATYLNQRHTVFGEIVDGQTVVDAINAVPVIDFENRIYIPVDDVTINTVTIIREGTAAESFDANAYSQPTYGAPDIDVSIQDDEYFLNFDLQPNYQYLVYGSPDLEDWTYIGPLSRTYIYYGRRDISLGTQLPGGTRGFWRATRTNYPAMPDKDGYSIDFFFSGGSGTPLNIELGPNYTGTFDNAGDGDYDITYYTWHEFGENRIILTVYTQSFPALQFTFEQGSNGPAQLLVNDSNLSNNSDDSQLFENMTFELTEP
ncbi:peptidylprolyl isomerase [Cerasicoccus arenae]|nr:peptidylprolyl isomerase [Cerasicoccus arenae]